MLRAHFYFECPIKLFDKLLRISQGYILYHYNTYICNNSSHVTKTYNLLASGHFICDLHTLNLRIVLAIWGYNHKYFEEGARGCGGHMIMEKSRARSLTRRCSTQILEI